MQGENFVQHFPWAIRIAQQLHQMLHAFCRQRRNQLARIEQNFAGRKPGQFFQPRTQKGQTQIAPRIPLHSEDHTGWQIVGQRNQAITLLLALTDVLQHTNDFDHLPMVIKHRVGAHVGRKSAAIYAQVLNLHGVRHAGRHTVFDGCFNSLGAFRQQPGAQRVQRNAVRLGFNAIQGGQHFRRSQNTRLDIQRPVPQLGLTLCRTQHLVVFLG